MRLDAFIAELARYRPGRLACAPQVAAQMCIRDRGARLIETHGAREPIAVLAFDLDQFKGINDRYGHHTCLLYTSQGGFRHDATGPDRRDQVVARDDAVALPCQVGQQVEYPRRRGHGLAGAV